MKIFILSAKYGLVDPETVIEPYDETLKTQSRERVRMWAAEVSRKLAEVIPTGRVIELHAGAEYIRYLDLRQYRITNPVQGLSIGRRLQWYNQHL